ncbi:cobaltochelatase CobN [Rhizobium sp. AN5]|nr:cobaltochelatase CobN [Rhizobium sp. AN5]
MRAMRAGYTPLCPAGHLPHKGGDQQEALSPLHPKTSRRAKSCCRSISLPVGEMPGRAEGGEAPRTEHSQ